MHLRRIILHTHTVSTEIEEHFNFSIGALYEHVRTNSLDVIAITNHNIIMKQITKKSAKCFRKP